MSVDDPVKRYTFIISKVLKIECVVPHPVCSSVCEKKITHSIRLGGCESKVLLQNVSLLQIGHDKDHNDT